MSADGTPLPPFEAGAHLDVQVPGGPVRSYSLCNDPAERHRYLIAVLREPASRGGSAGMHARVQEGTVLTCSAPRRLHPRNLTPTTCARCAGLLPICCHPALPWLMTQPGYQILFRVNTAMITWLLPANGGELR